MRLTLSMQPLNRVHDIGVNPLLSIQIMSVAFFGIKIALSLSECVLFLVVRARSAEFKTPRYLLLSIHGGLRCYRCFADGAIH